MKLLFELSREHNTLPRDEAFSCLKAEAVIYNVIISNENVTMLLAYMENDLYYSEIDLEDPIGPLRIAFVGDNIITSSNL